MHDRRIELRRGLPRRRPSLAPLVCASAVLLGMAAVSAASPRDARDDDPMEQRLYAAQLRNPRPGPAFEKWWEHATAHASEDEVRRRCIERTRESSTFGALLHLGLVHARLDDAEAALRCYDEAARQDPGSGRPALLSATLEADRGDEEAAVIALNRALEGELDETERRDARRRRSQLELRTGRRAQTLARWQALAADPDADADRREEAATTAAQEGEVEVALLLYDSLGRDAALDVARRFDASFAAAEIEARLRRGEGLRARWLSMLDLVDPQSWQARRLRETIAHDFPVLGGLDELRGFWEEALRRRPQDCDRRAALAAVLVRRGDFDEAARQWLELLELAPNRVDLGREGLMQLVRRGACAAAVPLAERLASLHPDDAALAVRPLALELLDARTAVADREGILARAGSLLDRHVQARARELDFLREAGQTAVALVLQPGVLFTEHGAAGLMLDARSVVWGSVSAEGRRLLARAEGWWTQAWRGRGDDADLDELLTLAVFLHGAEGVRARHREWLGAEAPVERTLQLADALRRWQRPEDAAAVLDQALGERPDLHPLLDARLRLAIESEQWGLEDELLDRCLRAAPEDRIFSTIDDLIEYDAKRGALERRIAQLAASCTPASPARDWIHLAHRHARSDELERTADALNSALDRLGSNERLAREVVESQETFGLANQALQGWRELAERHPASARQYRRREVDLLLVTGDARGALPILAAMIEEEPRDAGLLVRQAQAFALLAQFQDAVDALRRAVDLSPTDPQLHLRLAEQYTSLGQITLALESFWQAYLHGALGRERDSTFAILARLARGHGRWGRLDQFFADRARTHGLDQQATRHRAQVLENNEKFAEAIDTMERLHLRHPEDLDVLDPFVDLMQRRQRLERATELQTLRVSLKGDDAARERLAWLQSSVGRREAARATWESLPAPLQVQHERVEQLARRSGMGHATDAAVAALRQHPSDPTLSWRAVWGLYRIGEAETAWSLIEDHWGGHWAAGEVTPFPVDESTPSEPRSTPWLPPPFRVRELNRFEVEEELEQTAEGRGVSLLYSPFSPLRHRVGEHAVPVWFRGVLGEGAPLCWPRFDQLDRAREVLDDCRRIPREGDRVDFGRIDAPFLQPPQPALRWSLAAAVLAAMREQGIDPASRIEALATQVETIPGAVAELRLGLRAFALPPPSRTGTEAELSLEHVLVLDDFRALCTRLNPPPPAELAPRLPQVVDSVRWIARRRPQDRVQLHLTAAAWLTRLQAAEAMAPLLADLASSDWTLAELLHLAPWAPECPDLAARARFEQRLLELIPETPLDPRLRLTLLLTLLRHCQRGEAIAQRLLVDALLHADRSPSDAEAPDDYHRRHIYVQRGDFAYDLVQLPEDTRTHVLDARFHVLIGLLAQRRQQQPDPAPSLTTELSQSLQRAGASARLIDTIRALSTDP